MKFRAGLGAVDKTKSLPFPEIAPQCLCYAAPSLFTIPGELSGWAEEDNVISARIIGLWAETQTWDLPDAK